MEKKTKNVEYG